MSNLLKNLLFALGLAVILWLGYMFFIRNAGGDDAVINEGAVVSPEVRQKAERFKSLLAEIERMQVDAGILTDLRFVSLVNFRQSIEDEPFGRSNPFAPLE